MEFHGVYHRSSDNYCYPLEKDNLIINLKTGYDIQRVYLHYGDPFASGIMGSNSKWDGERVEIIYKKKLPYQLWWTTTVRPTFKRCRYFFEMEDVAGDTYYYFEDKIYSQKENR